jgi:tetratricopeptide (TPR) repeat protein
VAEKLIWEETQPDAGVDLLAVIDNPAAQAVLRRFATSQVGDDEVRMRALGILAEAGEIAEGSVVRVWNQGQWREVEIRQVEISGEPETQYTPQVSRLLSQALEAHQRDDQDEAERLFLRMVELEPRAREAYNNLGAIYSHRGEHAQAREMYRKAVELDPGYVFPRCNLASYLLDEGDIEGAEAMLEPLSRMSRFHPQEMGFYSYTQARILIQREEYEGASRALELALQVYPGYEPAQNLLERLIRVADAEAGLGSFWEEQYRRDQAKRARLQAQLSSRNPTLAEALPLYTKNALTGMARVTLRFGGWSALRKAELIERIVAAFTDREGLEYVVAGLDDEERDALSLVLSHGGHMPWLEFDAAYGNDLDELPEWNWQAPETTMGRLRLCGLLVETTVDGELLVVVPSELRRPLREMLA